MPKEPVSYVVGERPASSAKQNQQIRDYITPALPIWNVCQWYDSDTQDLLRQQHHLGWYPYNSSKSVYDTLRLMFGLSTQGAVTFDFEVSFDSGANWQSATAGAGAAPVAIDPIASQGAASQTFSRDFDLTPIVGFQWLGLRVSVLAVLGYSIAYVAIGFLHNSDSDKSPF